MEIIKIANSFGYNKNGIEIDDTLYSNFEVSEFFKDSAHKRVDLLKMQFEKAYKILICSKNPISYELLKTLPTSCKGIITDKGTFCQIMNVEASKWNAVKVLANRLGISEENVVAFGDDYNDYEMIKNAGTGIAMENSEKEIKQIANFITDTNNNDGVLKYVKKYLLHDKLVDLHEL